MFTYEFIVAAALVTSPPQSVDAAELKGWLMPLRSPLVQLSLEGEIMDPREVGFMFVQPEGFAGDLKMLQARFQEFLSAPMIAECRRFPDRSMVNEFLTFNRAYRSDLSHRLILDLVHAEELRYAIQETDQLYQVWDAVRDARCDYYYVTVRRQSLLLLKQLVGDRAFYSGQLPPHVPVWRFSEN